MPVRLGDARGVNVVEDAMAHPESVIRVVACRQLGLFMMEARTRDVGWELLRAALADLEPDVRWQAVVQLDRLDDPRSALLLDEVSRQDHDADMRRWASENRQMRSPLAPEHG